LSCRVVRQLKHYFIPGRWAFPLHVPSYCYTDVNINKADTNCSYLPQMNRLMLLQAVCFKLRAL
jgi:hypothetical protein